MNISRCWSDFENVPSHEKLPPHPMSTGNIAMEDPPVLDVHNFLYAYL